MHLKSYQSVTSAKVCGPVHRKQQRKGWAIKTGVVPKTPSGLQCDLEDPSPKTNTDYKIQGGNKPAPYEALQSSQCKYMQDMLIHSHMLTCGGMVLVMLQWCGPKLIFILKWLSTQAIRISEAVIPVVRWELNFNCIQPSTRLASIFHLQFEPSNCCSRSNHFSHDYHLQVIR